MRIGQVRKEYEREIGIMKHSLSEIEGKMDLLLRENENVERLLKEKNKELQSWIVKFRQLEEEDRRKYEEVVFRFEEYKRVHSSLDLDAKFKAERTAYETQIVQLKQRIMEYEELNKVLSLDAKKLAKSNSEKFRELDQLRAEYSRLESQHHREHQESRSQLDTFKRSSLDVQEISTRHASEVARYKNQVNQLEQVNANLKSELDSVYGLLERRKLDDSKNLRTIEELRGRVSLEGKHEVSHGRDGGAAAEYIQELEERLRTSEENQKRLDDLHKKNALELSHKNEELIEKIRELDALKRNYEASLHELGNVRSSVVTSTVLRKSYH